MKIVLMLSLISSLTYAKTVGRVLDISGAAFIYDKSNKVSELTYSQKIPASSKIMLEDNATAVVVTEDGTKYYLTSGSFVKFYEDGIELNSGKVWVDVGVNSKHRVTQTPNLKSNHKKGQYVYSFNPATERSDVLSIYGECEVSSLLDKNKKTKVLAGQFSTLNINKNNGYPREATRVGMNSYEGIKLSFSSFKDLQNLKINKEMATPKLEHKSNRAIASVSKSSRKGSVSFVKYDYKERNRDIASVSTSKKVSTNKAKESKSAKVRFFSLDRKVKIKNKITNRIWKTKPESNHVVSQVKRIPSSVARGSTVNLFEKSLRKNIKNTPKHSSEVNQLIDELKSYQEDFTKEY